MTDNVKRRGESFRMAFYLLWSVGKTGERQGKGKARAREEQRKSIGRAQEEHRKRENVLRNESHVLDVVLDSRVPGKRERLHSSPITFSFIPCSRMPAPILLGCCSDSARTSLVPCAEVRIQVKRSVKW